LNRPSSDQKVIVRSHAVAGNCRGALRHSQCLSAICSWDCGGQDFVKTLIVGIEDGFGAAKDELDATGKPKLYCAPEGVKFMGDQLVEILRKWVDANWARAPRLDAAPPATALLYALDHEFPCK
jgi:hypothetical protein